MGHVPGDNQSPTRSAVISADLSIEALSTSLAGRKIDVIVSGSIGAIESARLIRSLRRLGARVFPWLTSGGAQFTTETSLGWASAEPVRTSFSGHLGHLAENDACVFAPASANFLSKLAHGMTDSPALALAASYRGGKKPILVVPNMHDSLWLNPSLQKNISTLQDVIFYPPRAEEGKQKFPEPSQFADWISHQINLRTFRSPPRILLTMGSTRGYLDEVRFFGNDSSGRLGTEICQELFRRGSLMDLIIGPCSHQPDQWNKRWDVISTQEMEQAVRESLSNGAKHGIFCAAVLDYEPTARQAGKMSSQGGSFTVQLKPTEKIIRLASLLPGYKVGFKLQPQDTDAASIANRYIRQYGLNLLIHNRLGAIGQDHHAECFHAASSNPQHPISVTGKRPLAQYISRCIFADITP